MESKPDSKNSGQAAEGNVGKDAAPLLAVDKTSAVVHEEDPLTAVVLVLLCGTWFLVVSMYLCLSPELVEPEIAAAWRAQQPWKLYEWSFVGYLTKAVLLFIGLFTDPVSCKRPILLLALFIVAIATASSWLLWQDHPAMLLGVHGRPVLLVRPAMWGSATPIALYLLSKLGNLPRWKVHLSVCLNFLMIWMGTLSEFMPIVPRVLMATASFAMFFYVMRIMFCCCIKGKKQSSLKLLGSAVLVTWSFFPLFWLLGQAGVLEFAVEERLLTVLDLFGKVVQTSFVLQMRFQSFGEQRELRMLMEKIAQKDARIAALKENIAHKSGFISEMSHDLRTPLNGIIGLSESLMCGTCGPLGPKVSHTLKTVMNSGTKLLHLINALIDACSLSEGSLTIKNGRVDLAPIVREVMEYVSLMTSRSVVVTNQVPPQLPAVPGDASRLAQMLATLLSHAIRNTRRGSVTIDARFNMAMVQVTVTDTSKGMSDAAIATIMDPRPHANPAQNLGLRLVRQLVAAHSGDMTIASTDKGVTYTLALPTWQDGNSHGGLEHLYSTQTEELMHTQTDMGSAQPSCDVIDEHASTGHADSFGVGEGSADDDKAENAALMMSEKQPYKPSHCQQYGFVRVLSVDDDPVNQMVIQNLLAPVGYEIVQAMDGIEALEFLQSETTLPDVVLLDVMMPGMSGYEVCRRLRGMYPNALIPVIMVSAKSKKEHIVEGLRAGSNDYVTKPFGREEILARIEAHLRFKDAVTAQLKQGSGAHVPGNADEAGDGDDDLTLATVTLADGTPGRAALAAEFAARLTANRANWKSLHESYPNLTIAAVGIANLQALRHTKAPKMLSMMKEFFASLDNMLDKHDVYKVDQFGSTIVLVAGLDGRPDHTDRMLRLVTKLHETVEGILCNTTPLKLRVGIDVGSAHGVVTNVQYPVLSFYGEAPMTAMLLESTCPSACVHVSAAVRAKLSDADKDSSLIPTSRAPNTTYLVSSVAAQLIQAEGNMYMMLEDSPAELMDSTIAKQALKPSQSALVYMTSVTPHLLAGLELGGSGQLSNSGRMQEGSVKVGEKADAGASARTMDELTCSGPDLGASLGHPMHREGASPKPMGAVESGKAAEGEKRNLMSTNEMMMLSMTTSGAEDDTGEREKPEVPGAQASGDAGRPHELISEFLGDCGLAGYADKFVAEGITLSVLPHLDDQALIKLGLITMGARFRLRQACANSLDAASAEH